MNAPVRWIKSSFSANNGACVEVAATPAQVAARDSKNADGPVLTFHASAWAAFVTEVSGDR
jgi:hypothetical protein